MNDQRDDADLTAGDWNPRLYLRFEPERMRAARDLLAQVVLTTAGSVYDLDCGPGGGAKLLQRRFPEACLVGVDSSESMLDTARRRAPGVRFVQENIESWTPEAPADLIFANAALHFLPDHERLFARLVSFLRPGGCLAAQMPNLTREASHAAMRLVAADGPWADRLVPIAKTRPVIASFENYHTWLRRHCESIDIWMTTYIHRLRGATEIVEWFAGSALQPFLGPLDERERREFLRRYHRELEQAYPVDEDGGVFLTYPRLFIVAVRTAD